MYRRATAQTLFDATIAITTSARSFGGYFRPRWLPCTVFLQYARFFVIYPPSLCRGAQPFPIGRTPFTQHSQNRPAKGSPLLGELAALCAD